MRGILVCPQLKVILLEEGKGLCREAAPPKKKTAWLVRKSMKIHFLVPFKTSILFAFPLGWWIQAFGYFQSMLVMMIPNNSYSWYGLTPSILGLLEKTHRKHQFLDGKKTVSL